MLQSSVWTFPRLCLCGSFGVHLSVTYEFTSASYCSLGQLYFYSLCYCITFSPPCLCLSCNRISLQNYKLLIFTFRASLLPVYLTLHCIPWVLLLGVTCCLAFISLQPLVPDTILTLCLGWAVAQMGKLSGESTLGLTPSFGSPIPNGTLGSTSLLLQVISVNDRVVMI